MSRFGCRLRISLALALVAYGCAFASTAAVTWNKVYGGLAQPVDITGARDGSGRLFIAQQTGQIRLVKNGALVATPFLDLSGLTTSSGEQGMLGLVFHPQYATNRQFFVNYTRTSDGATVIARYTAPTAASDTADPASAQILLVIAQPYANHNGGALKFGPDGYLYIGMGDGGSGNDPQARAQDKTTLLGKILRIDVDHGSPYAIPAGNPWANGVGGLPELFTIGLRNPWRISFDRFTGDFWIGDVGQGAVEEIDRLAAGTGAGANFGWRMMEGNTCTGLTGPVPCNDPSLTPPVLSYTHSLGCSVTGGYVYRGSQVPSLGGQYVYGDFCSGRLWSAAFSAGQWIATQLSDTAYQVSTFGEDDAGELYFADYATGDIYKFAETAPPANPVLSLSASSIAFGSVTVGQSATRPLTVTNTGGGTLTLTSVRVGSAFGGSSTEFLLSGNCANGTALAGGQSCTANIQFAPVSPGNKASSLSIASSAGNANVPLSGTGVAGTPAPLLNANPTTLGFGTVVLGNSSAPQTVTVSNAGAGTLTLGTLTPGGAHPGDFARSGTCASGTNLSAGQSCTVICQFTPTTTGARSATLAIASNGGSATLNLSGTGSTAPTTPVLTASELSLSFPNTVVGGSSATQTVTVTNTGAGTLTLGTLTPGGANPGDFVQSGTCANATALAATQSCTVIYRFAPTALGARAASLAITSNGGNATITVTGTGTTRRGGST